VLLGHAKQLDKQPALHRMGRQAAGQLAIGIDRLEMQRSANLAELLFGVHSPRSIASWNFAAISLSASGFFSRRKRKRFLIHQIGLVDGIEMRIAHRPRGRGEGEQIIDRRRHLEGALVAVPLDPSIHFGLTARPRTTRRDLFLERADHRTLGPRMIVVIDRRPAAAQVSTAAVMPPSNW
jgi:hypothetical protein